MQTLLVEASALGLGSYMASVGTAASVDFTGIIGAIVVAVSGLYIVPFQRSLMKKKLRKTIENIRTNTRTILVSHFDKEMRKVEIEIKNSFSPYS